MYERLFTNPVNGEKIAQKQKIPGNAKSALHTILSGHIPSPYPSQLHEKVYPHGRA